MITCRYCGSEKVIKKGKNPKGNTRFLCKECHSYFLKDQDYIKKRYHSQLKQIAIRLYTDGVEIAVIARSLQVPYETVRSWIRNEGEKAIKKTKKENNTCFEKISNLEKPELTKCGLS